MSNEFCKSTDTRQMVLRGAGVPFERIRRVTGYLSVLTRFNDAKQAEERMREKHVLSV